MNRQGRDLDGRVRRQRKARESQDRILTHAAKVMAEEGFEKASIRKIAADMGMSISALYYYFASKEDVLFSIQYRCFTELLDLLDRRLVGVEGAEQQLHILINNHLAYFLERLDALTICSRETKTLKGEAYNQVWQVRRQYYMVALDIVQRIARENPQSKFNPSLATLNLFGMLNWIYMWFDPTKTRSPRSLTDEIHHLFLHGIKSGRSEPAVHRDREH